MAETLARPKKLSTQCQVFRKRRCAMRNTPGIIFVTRPIFIRVRSLKDCNSRSPCFSPCGPFTLGHYPRKDSPRMFVSFFPQPRLFFWSVVIWTLFAIAAWYRFGSDIGLALGILPATPETVDAASVSVFLSRQFIWFYIYYAFMVAVFAAFWMIYAPHPWASW